MKDRLKIISLGLAVMCIVPLLITNQYENEKCIEDENTNNSCETIEYLSNYNFSQKSLQLEKEFVQYKIKFYENTTVDYEYFLKFRVKDLHPLYYFIVFTDGKKGVMKRKIDGKFYEAPIIGQSMIPLGILLDINLFKLHFSIGKLLFKILPIGNKDKIKGSIKVQEATEWYLTMCVYHKTDEEIFYINLKSEIPSFEIIDLNRDSKIEYLNSASGDFEGLYFGVKIISHGFSYSKNLEKSITTTRGTVIIFNSIGHFNGKINIIDPKENVFSKNSRQYANLQYYGNQTGKWKFSSSGIGIGRKHMVSLFYMDVDPHFDLIDF